MLENLESKTIILFSSIYPIRTTLLQFQKNGSYHKIPTLIEKGMVKPDKKRIDWIIQKLRDKGQNHLVPHYETMHNLKEFPYQNTPMISV